MANGPDGSGSGGWRQWSNSRTEYVGRQRKLGAITRLRVACPTTKEEERLRRRRNEVNELSGGGKES